MAITGSPDINALLYVLIGEPLMQANEDLAYASHRPFKDLASGLNGLSEDITQSIRYVGNALPPGVADQYVKAMRTIVDDGGVNHITDFTKNLDEIGDGRVQTSINITQAKWEIIAELVLLMIELLVIAVLSFFTGGATAGDGAAAKARTRVTVLTVMSNLAKRTHVMPTLSEALEEAFTTFATRLAMITHGPAGRKPHGFNVMDILAAGVGGAFNSIFEHGFHGGKALGKDLFNNLSKNSSAPNPFTKPPLTKNTPLPGNTPNKPHTATNSATVNGPHTVNGIPGTGGTTSFGDKAKNFAKSGADTVFRFTSSGTAEGLTEVAVGAAFYGQGVWSWQTFHGAGVSSLNTDAMMTGAHNFAPGMQNLLGLTPPPTVNTPHNVQTANAHTNAAVTGTGSNPATPPAGLGATGPVRPGTTTSTGSNRPSANTPDTDQPVIGHSNPVDDLPGIGDTPLATVSTPTPGMPNTPDTHSPSVPTPNTAGGHQPTSTTSPTPRTTTGPDGRHTTSSLPQTTGADPDTPTTPAPAPDGPVTGTTHAATSHAGLAGATNAPAGTPPSGAAHADTGVRTHSSTDPGPRTVDTSHDTGPETDTTNTADATAANTPSTASPHTPDTTTSPDTTVRNDTSPTPTTPTTTPTDTAPPMNETSTVHTPDATFLQDVQAVTSSRPGPVSDHQAPAAQNTTTPQPSTITNPTTGTAVSLATDPTSFSDPTATTNPTTTTLAPGVAPQHSGTPTPPAPTPTTQAGTTPAAASPTPSTGQDRTRRRGETTPPVPAQDGTEAQDTTAAQTDAAPPTTADPLTTDLRNEAPSPVPTQSRTPDPTPATTQSPTPIPTTRSATTPDQNSTADPQAEPDADTYERQAARDRDDFSDEETLVDPQDLAARDTDLDDEATLVDPEDLAAREKDFEDKPFIPAWTPDDITSFLNRAPGISPEKAALFDPDYTFPPQSATVFVASIDSPASDTGEKGDDAARSSTGQGTAADSFSELEGTIERTTLAERIAAELIGTGAQSDVQISPSVPRTSQLSILVELQGRQRDTHIAKLLKSKSGIEMMLEIANEMRISENTTGDNFATGMSVIKAIWHLSDLPKETVANMSDSHIATLISAQRRGEINSAQDREAARDRYIDDQEFGSRYDGLSSDILLDKTHDYLTHEMRLVTNIPVSYISRLLSYPHGRLVIPSGIPSITRSEKFALPEFNASLVSPRFAGGVPGHGDVVLHWKKSVRSRSTFKAHIGEGATETDTNNLYSLLVDGHDDTLRLAYAEATGFARDLELLGILEDGERSPEFFPATIYGDLSVVDLERVVINYPEGWQHAAEADKKRIYHYARANGNPDLEVSLFTFGALMAPDEIETSTVEGNEKQDLIDIWVDFAARNGTEPAVDSVRYMLRNGLPFEGSHQLKDAVAEWFDSRSPGTPQWGLVKELETAINAELSIPLNPEIIEIEPMPLLGTPRDVGQNAVPSAHDLTVVRRLLEGNPAKALRRFSAEEAEANSAAMSAENHGQETLAKIWRREKYRISKDIDIFGHLSGLRSWAKLEPEQITALVMAERKGQEIYEATHDSLLEKMHSPQWGWAASYPMSNGGTRSLINEAHTFLREKMNLTVNVNLEKRIKSGKTVLELMMADPLELIKNGWVTEPMGIAYLDHRGNAEAILGYSASVKRNVGWGGSYPVLTSSYGQGMFSPTEADRSALPKYAALTSPSRPEGVPGYGKTVFYLKDEVRTRSTFTPSDSFSLNSPGALGVTSARNLLPLMLHGDESLVRLAFADATDFRYDAEYRRMRDEGILRERFIGRYFEAQIHGILGWEDLARVVLDSDDESNRSIKNRLEDFAAERGFDFVVEYRSSVG